MSDHKRVSLGNRFKAVAFLLVTASFALVLAGQSVRLALATALGKSSRIAQIRKAVSLDFPNPDLHFRLGLAETYSMDPSYADSGIRQLQLATRLSPHETRYWSALASACEFEGNKVCAGNAIKKTLTLSPMAPRIHWEAANYYLWANSQPQALYQFRRLLELGPSYARATFRATIRATDDPEVVYRDVLTSTSSSNLKLAYIEFLSTHGEGDFALNLWNEVVAGKSNFTFSAADPYLEHLIGARKYREASTVWRGLEKRGVVQRPRSYGDLVFNGGFEHFPLNAGFDWRYQKSSYVAIDFEGHHPYQGKRCLQLDFRDVDNHRDEPVFQLVPVLADQTYLLTAEVRSSDLNSASTPRLRVADPDCRKCLNVTSEAIVGTTPWHQISLKFRTGPRTVLVRLSLWRARSLGFPAEILGTVWMDNVSLKAVPPDENQLVQRQGS